jgi:putative exporter of polyketide antibiotics
VKHVRLNLITVDPALVGDVIRYVEEEARPQVETVRATAVSRRSAIATWVS